MAAAALASVGAAAAAEPAPTTPIVVRVDEGGFQWTDAGIGAAAGFGAALVLAGSIALTRLSATSASATRLDRHSR
jgi:hypothetical protein